MEERLHKVLAAAGVASRRASESLIQSGRVAVNGQVVRELGLKVDPSRDVISVDGKRVDPAPPKRYLLLNKPRGYVTTRSDPHAEHTVMELVEDAGAVGLYPVGRLDADTSGLLLFTNDGDFALRLTHPRYKVPKTYIALVDGTVPDNVIERLSRGVSLDDGPTAPAGVQRRKKHGRGGQARTELEITIAEGRNRQVRRMCETVGHPVIELARVRLGPLTLGDLPEGTWRDLTPDEVRALLEPESEKKTYEAGTLTGNNPRRRKRRHAHR